MELTRCFGLLLVWYWCYVFGSLSTSPVGKNSSVLLNETISMTPSNEILERDTSHINGSMIKRTDAAKPEIRAYFQSRRPLRRYKRWNAKNKTESRLRSSSLYSNFGKLKAVCQPLTNWNFSQSLPNPLLSSNKSWTCPVRNSAISLSSMKITDDIELGDKILLTDTSIKNHTEPGNCTVVVFFASWCNMSARAAPHFNAIPRAFENIRFVAVDIYNHSEVISTFGIFAVPTVLLFHNGRIQARFVNESIHIFSLADFIEKFSDQNSSSLKIRSSDFHGPIPTVAVPIGREERLMLAWLFILLSFVYLLFTKPVIGLFLTLHLFMQSLSDDVEFADSKFKMG